jgi:hypothetical protein
MSYGRIRPSVTAGDANSLRMNELLRPPVRTVGRAIYAHCALRGLWAGMSMIGQVWMETQSIEQAWPYP